MDKFDELKSSWTWLISLNKQLFKESDDEELNYIQEEAENTANKIFEMSEAIIGKVAKIILNLYNSTFKKDFNYISDFDLNENNELCVYISDEEDETDIYTLEIHCTYEELVGNLCYLKTPPTVQNASHCDLWIVPIEYGEKILKQI